jgi:hypothetical protein
LRKLKVNPQENMGPEVLGRTPVLRAFGGSDLRLAVVQFDALAN